MRGVYEDTFAGTSRGAGERTVAARHPSSERLRPAGQNITR